MNLTHRQIHNLVGLLGRTRENELTCQECLEHVAEFAEHELAGKPIPEALEAVGHHLSLCPECSEEYSALRTALERLAKEEGSRPD